MQNLQRHKNRWGLRTKNWLGHEKMQRNRDERRFLSLSCWGVQKCEWYPSLSPHLSARIASMLLYPLSQTCSLSRSTLSLGLLALPVELCLLLAPPSLFTSSSPFLSISPLFRLTKRFAIGSCCSPINWWSLFYKLWKNKIKCVF